MNFFVPFLCLYAIQTMFMAFYEHAFGLKTVLDSILFYLLTMLSAILSLKTFFYINSFQDKALLILAWVGMLVVLYLLFRKHNIYKKTLWGLFLSILYATGYYFGRYIVI